MVIGINMVEIGTLFQMIIFILPIFQERGLVFFTLLNLCGFLNFYPLHKYIMASDFVSLGTSLHLLVSPLPSYTFLLRVFAPIPSILFIFLLLLPLDLDDRSRDMILFDRYRYRTKMICLSFLFSPALSLIVSLISSLYFPYRVVSQYHSTYACTLHTCVIYPFL